MTQATTVGADAGWVGREFSVVYGAEKPPTVEEQRVQQMAELRQSAADGWAARDAVEAAHAELDRLGAPRRTADGYLFLGVDERIRYLACGSRAHGAQPALLQEWAPEVWSGERLAPKPRTEATA